MQQLGHLILSLVTGGPSIASNASKSLESISRLYSTRLRETLSTLVSPTPPDIDTFLSSIADQLVVQFDNILHLEDTLYSELSRELENSRISRLLIKLGFINERPEMDAPRSDFLATNGSGHHHPTHGHTSVPPGLQQSGHSSMSAAHASHTHPHAQHLSLIHI